MKRNGTRIWAVWLTAALCLATLPMGMLKEKVVQAETDASVTGQYESDSAGNPVDEKEGTSRYYTEYVTSSQTVYISNESKQQVVPIEIKKPYTNIKYITYDISKGIDSDGYRFASNCRVYFCDSDNKTLESETELDESEEPVSFYQKYTNLNEGNYKIVVCQAVEPYEYMGEMFERLIEGFQKVEYTMYRVIDRQAPPSETPIVSASPQASGTPAQSGDDSSWKGNGSTGQTTPDGLLSANSSGSSSVSVGNTTTTKSGKNLSVTGLVAKRNTKKITGKTMGKASIKVTVNGKTYKVKANKKGKFTVRLKKRIKKNTKIKIKVTLKNHKSYCKTIQAK